jgi:hypothetical protein
MPDDSRSLAIKAVNDAFETAVQDLVRQVRIGLIDSKGDAAAAAKTFQAGLAYAKQARDIAITGIGQTLV